MPLADNLWALRSKFVLDKAEVPSELHLGADVWDALRAEVKLSAIKLAPPPPTFLGIKVYVDYDNKQRMEFK